MSCATLMVHLGLDRSNAGVLAIAGDLSVRFQSRVIGIAVGQPGLRISGDGYVPADMIQQDIRDMEKKITAAEAEFRAAFRQRNTAVEWRSRISFEPLADYIAVEARCADMILASSPEKSEGERMVVVDTGALVLQAGRPILVVPPGARELRLGKAVIFWKDTREARRAVIDAMHILKKAGAVDVIEVTTVDDLEACRSRLQDVVDWLAVHGVSAMQVACPSDGDEKATLKFITAEREADLIVAGAYGHSRFREWVLGGVTRELWMHSTYCALLSH